MAYGRGAAAVRAIDEVTLGIAAGEFIAVVGPSGCGKSSLMRLISGLHPLLGGTLTVEGRPVSGPLKSVGMAFQNSNLLPWRNALDNVLLPLEIVEPHRGRMRAERKAYRAKAQKLLESVGLGGFTEKFPWERLYALERGEAQLTDAELQGFADLGWLSLLAPEPDFQEGLRRILAFNRKAVDA